MSDADQLHQVIGRALIRKSHLTGSDLRFLRKELGLSQTRLAQIVGPSEQSVSLWGTRRQDSGSSATACESCLFGSP